jgi:hypothetical protein
MYFRLITHKLGYLYLFRFVSASKPPPLLPLGTTHRPPLLVAGVVPGGRHLAPPLAAPESFVVVRTRVRAIALLLRSHAP